LPRRDISIYHFSQYTFSIFEAGHANWMEMFTISTKRQEKPTYVFELM